jgi:hypothetical protein
MIWRCNPHHDKTVFRNSDKQSIAELKSIFFSLIKKPLFSAFVEYALPFTKELLGVTKCAQKFIATVLKGCLNMLKWTKLSKSSDRQRHQEDDNTRLVNSSESKSGSVIRWLAEYREKITTKDKEVVMEELPNMIKELDVAKNLINTLNLNNLSGRDISPLIEKTNKVKKWIGDHKNVLGISEKEYNTMREKYVIARNNLERSQGERFDPSSMLNALEVAYGVKLVKTIRTATPDQITVMKQQALDAALTFLEEANTKLQIHNSFCDACDE